MRTNVRKREPLYASLLRWVFGNENYEIEHSAKNFWRKSRHRRDGVTTSFQSQDGGLQFGRYILYSLTTAERSDFGTSMI
jgi:hypothetical protein